MANFNGLVTTRLIDRVLPTYGNRRQPSAVWDESQKMFILDEYESASGHRYYSGVRFCDRIVIREKVGLYHNWTYIDSIELYAFNGQRLELIQKRDFDKQFRTEEFVRQRSEEMIGKFLQAAAKMSRVKVGDADVALQARALVDGCYKSILDKDFNLRLTKILPAIGQ